VDKEKRKMRGELYKRSGGEMRRFIIQEMNPIFPRNILFLILAMLLIIGIGAKPEKKPELTCRSYGLIKFGDKLTHVEKLMKEKSDKTGFDFECDYVAFKKYPDVDFMVEEGIVTRAESTSANVLNSLGIKILDSLESVLRRYPNVQMERHAYDEGHYLIFKSSDGKYAMVFEEVQGEVVNVLAGLEPSVEYVEGCL
jgi:hypothetical protein